jgi:hypothetical protein
MNNTIISVDCPQIIMYYFTHTNLFFSVKFHVEDGAKKVIISALSPYAPMFVVRVNFEAYDTSMNVI